jgi:putative transcriptional regulator
MTLAVAAGAEEPLRHSPYLKGQFLIANPTMPDPRFRETVIYMANHDSRGAFGLVVNHKLGRGPLKDLLADAGIEAADKAVGEVDIYVGGPVSPQQVFILHRSDWTGPETDRLAEDLFLTTTPDILEAMAKGEGPGEFRIIIGYSGWGPGQLEKEMGRGDWITAPGDAALVFDTENATKWPRASRKGGLGL